LPVAAVEKSTIEVVVVVVVAVVVVDIVKDDVAVEIVDGGYDYDVGTVVAVDVVAVVAADVDENECVERDSSERCPSQDRI
jgi:hypothetical protein